MAKPSFPTQPAPAAAESALPAVRLEVRAGAGRSTPYDVGESGFLIGTVPGCDLRLPGANLPPVLCLVVRHAGGAHLRKLAPVQPVAVNGRAVTSTALNSGDKIAIGSVEIVVQFGAVARPSGVVPSADSTSAAQVRAGEARQRDEARALEVERGAWEARRGEFEAECRARTAALEQTAQRLQREEDELNAARAEFDAFEKARVGVGGDQAEELLGWRKDLEHLKHQMHERFRQKRERLAKMGHAVRRAALRVQRRKHEVEAEVSRLAVAAKDTDQRHTELDANREQFARERRILEEQHGIITTRQQNLQREMAARFAEVEAREKKLAEEKGALDTGQKQHQADLVRLDRAQGVLDQRQKQLQERALEVDRRSEQLQRDTRELEEQAASVDELRERLTQGYESLEPRRKGLQELGVKLDQRAAALESQQAMIATLRTRMERMRDELRHQEQALAEQRVVQEQAESELRQRLEETRRLRQELVSEKELFEQERRRFEERRATLDQAVAELRQAQQAQAPAEEQLGLRQQELDLTAAQQAEQAGVLLARGQQLEEMHARAAADRQALRERETTLARAEITLGTLQEQLRRRGEELAERERSLVEREGRVKEAAEQHEAALRAWEEQKKLGAEGIDAQRLDLNNRAAQLDALARELSGREETLTTERRRLDEEFRALEQQRHGLQAERVAAATEKQAVAEAAAREQSELDATRARVADAARDLPELEARAAAAVERLARGQQQLRAHLAELHDYTRQSQADLETARRQIRDEAERLRQRELDLHARRDEHRLAVAGYRQQLAEWQGHVAEMRQTLSQGASRLDRRQAEVEQQAQQVAAVRDDLAQQAEQLQDAERGVVRQRDEMARHLGEMREWYRKKMRELSGIDAVADTPDGAVPDVVRLPVSAETGGALASEHGLGDRGILALTGDVEPGDRQLGDMLRSLELVDSDTLTALLQDARRQRRTLRQLLLAGNYLTLYQMALIEAGNIGGLALGPVRVIDRLRATPREAVYRVFDPRGNREALLRHLGEGEMLDAVRPDEFRQRFAAAATLQHENLATTYEVVDIAGRPAVLQEWLNGLTSSDWPTLAAAPGVWFRLVSQAALALQAAHTAGLTHGHLQSTSFVLTGDGVVKITGLGEPRWLSAVDTESESEPSAADDLKAFGHVVAEWAAGAPDRPGIKAKRLPDALLEITRRLAWDLVGERFESAGDLHKALEAAGPSVPANAAAWERFVKQVREQSEDVALRRTA